MDETERARKQLVMANRILAHEGVLDAYGHVSVRHPAYPDRYILSRARAPELVEETDLFDFRLDGQPLTRIDAAWYSERYIHGAVYETRPDVQAVCHSHLPSVLGFSITRTPLQAVFHSASFLGEAVPVWDIADEFGTATQLRVHNREEGLSLSRTLGQRRVALMRGHGCVVAAEDLITLTFCCIYLNKNATAQFQGLLLGGGVTPLHPGEISARESAQFDTRAWEVWAHRAGVQGLDAG